VSSLILGTDDEALQKTIIWTPGEHPSGAGMAGAAHNTDRIIGKLEIFT
jgi:hypothetical protein